MNGHNLASRPEFGGTCLLAEEKQLMHTRPAPIGGVTTETDEREPMIAR